MKINSRATTSSFYTVENKTAYILSLQRMLGIPQSGRLDTQTVKEIVDLKTKYLSTEILKCKILFQTQRNKEVDIQEHVCRN